MRHNERLSMEPVVIDFEIKLREVANKTINYKMEVLKKSVKILMN